MLAAGLFCAAAPKLFLMFSLATLNILAARMEVNHEIKRLPDADLVLADITPRQLLRIAGSQFPGRYRRRLERFRYGAVGCRFVSLTHQSIMINQSIDCTADSLMLEVFLGYAGQSSPF
jgi:hypothetical protein